MDSKTPAFKELPSKVKVYILFWALAFIPLMTWVFSQHPLKGINWLDFLVFLVLAVFFLTRPLIYVSQSVSYFVNDLVAFATILLFRPEAVVLFAVISNFLADSILRKRFWAAFLNLASLASFGYLASLAYNYLKASQPFYENLPVNLPALVMATIISMGLNILEFGFSLSLVDNQYFKKSLKQINKGMLLFGLGQYPVAILMAMIYHYQRFALVLFTIPFVLFYFAYHYQSRLEVKEQEAIRDSLTALYNRRHLNQILSGLLCGKRALSFIIFDIDNFKELNDTLGHLEGDKALRSIANITLKAVRDKDKVFRYGGEEFSIVLPDTSKETAVRIAERLRHDIKSSFCNNKHHALTISLGVASFPEDGKTMDKLINKADSALYKAKRQGKNRVIAA